MGTESIALDGLTVELSNLDKIFFPDEGYTKGDLITYYERIAAVIIPHMRDRPISMQRFPDGIGANGFYQKEIPDHFPNWIDRVYVDVREEGSQQPQVICNKAATLIYLVNQGTVTPHIWLSRSDKLNYPDRLIFDLDPPEGDFEAVRFAARALRGLLQDVALVPYVMTTGSKGLHVVAPLDRAADFDAVRRFARELADVLVGREPDRLTTEISKDKRRGRVFLDYLRNAYAQTVVAPYAVRPLGGAPVATPLDWDELAEPGLHSRRYNIKNIFRRLGQKEDPWKDMMDNAHTLKEARSRLEHLKSQ